MLTELKKHMKIIKTCNLYLSMFTLGMAVSLTGPCLLDLQHMVQTDTQHIALIYTSRSIGGIVGAIFGGILLDIVKSKQAVLTVSNALISATMFAIPWCRNVSTLLGFMVVNGLNLGAIETGGNVICLQLWGKDSNPIFQGLHFTFGLGGVLSPLVAAPFLEYQRESEPYIENATYLDDISFASMANDFSNATNTSGADSRFPRITYPFSMIGAFGVLVVILHLAVCIVSPTEDGILEEDKRDNSDKSFVFMFFAVLFIFLLFFVVAGTEIGYAQTLTTYAVKGQLHVTTTTGSYMTSAFWASFTIFRLLSVYFAMKFSSLKLIIADVSVVSISAFILLFLMPNEWALWLTSVVFGIGIASAYASCVGWLGEHLNITNKISATLSVGCSVGEMVVPFIIAYFIEIIPEMLAFVTAASCILITILVFILHCMFKLGEKANESKSTDCYVIDAGVKEC